MNLGTDLSGGLFRRGYWPSNPGGLWYAIAVALGLLILHQLLQLVMAVSLLKLFVHDADSTRAMVKASLVSIFPASLIVAALGFWLAGLRGGDRRQVLSLRWPKFTPLGWAVLVIGFMLTLEAVILAIVLGLGIDLAQYTPGPNGESP